MRQRFKGKHTEIKWWILWEFVDMEVIGSILPVIVISTLVHWWTIIPSTLVPIFYCWKVKEFKLTPKSLELSFQEQKQLYKWKPFCHLSAASKQWISPFHRNIPQISFLYFDLKTENLFFRPTQQVSLIY